MSGAVGRGQEKLAHALSEFRVDVRGLDCADFGCNVGGFTQALLDAGAARVHAIDTGYGVLAWTLRNDPRVVVMERSNALHAAPPEHGVSLVAIDLAWTPQRLAIPAALRWLRPEDEGARILTLIKPHYEESAAGGRGGVLPEARAVEVARRVLGEMEALGARVLASTRSPILGGGRGKGNIEWLALLAPMER